MSRGKIILTSIFLIVLVGGVVFFLNHNPAPELPLAKTQPVKPSLSGIMYGADGKLDTSNWQEYRSEYGGFSVRAPKEVSAIGCFGHACDPSVWGERFFYVLFRTNINEEFGEVSFSINVIKKDKDSVLGTWLSNYIVSGHNQLFNVQKVSINGYPALQFDWQKKALEQRLVYMRSSIYPNGDTYTSVLVDPTAVISEISSSRFLVIDLGDRYAFVSHTLSIDKKALSDTYLGYLNYQRQALAIPDDKTLSDIYAAILSSFRAFAPTKP